MRGYSTAFSTWCCVLRKVLLAPIVTGTLILGAFSLVPFRYALADQTPIVSTTSAVKERQSQVLQLAGTRSSGYSHPKYKSYETLGRIASGACGTDADRAWMASILSFNIDEQSHRLHPEMFSLPPFARYLLQFKDCITDAQRRAVHDLLDRNEIDVFAHGTTNHAIMQSSSWYLLAQAFPDVIWTSVEGAKYSSQELMRLLSNKLLARQTAQLAHGFDEQFSPTYAIENFFPLLNLFDFASDPAVSSAAEAGLIQQLAMLYADSFHGLLVPPLGRNSHSQTNSPAPHPGMDISAGQHVLWYYSGEPALGGNDFVGIEPFYVLMLALSSWRPPAELSYLLDRREPVRIRTVTPSFYIWDNPAQPSLLGNAFISNEFAIGVGNFVFNPSWYNEDTNNFSIFYRSSDLYNYVQCYHPFWRSNAGPSAWLHDQSSPFMEGDLREDRGVLVFDIPTSDPWPQPETNRFFKLRDQHANSLIGEINCRFPTSVDEVKLDGKAIFLREGAVYVGIRLAGPSSSTFSEVTTDGSTFRDFRISARRAALYFRVGTEADAGDFVTFQKKTMQDDFRFDEARAEAEYPDRSGKHVNVKYRLQSGRAKPWISAIPRVSDQPSEPAPSGYLEAQMISAGPDGMVIRSAIGDLRIEVKGGRFSIIRN